MARIVLEMSAPAAKVFEYASCAAVAGFKVVEKDAAAQRVTLRSRPGPFSFGEKVKVSVLPVEGRCRVIVESEKLVWFNVSANLAGAVKTVAADLQRAFPRANS